MDSVLGAETQADLKELVAHYYGLTPQYTLKQICMIINNHHNTSTTVRQIKYICKKEGLTRYKLEDTGLKDVVANELRTSRRSVGYRQMSEIISLKYRAHVPKEKVRKVLKELDPEGVQERSRGVIKRRVYETAGPNKVWHIDGNDKLKMWGLCIHAAVDGFSRKIIWIKVSTTNNDPLVIANYYLSSVKAHLKAPKMLRMDKGTENIYCEDLQVFFTGNADSFRYASSTRNQ